MLRTFSWRHVLGFALVVCLGSMLVGAVLAQDEPDLPEPEVPVIDLSAASNEPAPAEPEIPTVQVPNNVVVISPSVNEITNPSPNDVVRTARPTFTWQVPTPITPTTFHFELYNASLPLDPPMPDGIPLTSTIVNGTPLPLTPTCNETTGQCSFSNLGFDLSDGRAYYWKVTGTAAPMPSAEATFIVDLPFVSPAPGQRVGTTTPYISFEQLPGVQFYQFASYVPSRRVVAWVEWFSAEGSSFPGYEQGICSDGICRVRPSVELTRGVEGMGDTDMQIWVQPWDGQLGDWRPLFGNPDDTFTIVAPRVNADLVNVATPGRPSYSVEREFTTVDTATGLTVTTAPDYYRIFALNPINPIQQFIDEWFVVDEANCDGNICPLKAFDGVQELLFNNDYDYYVLGYDTRINSYTSWSSRRSFRIAELAPNISSLQFAGIYEAIGPNPVNPMPKAGIETWTTCSGLTPSTTTPVCDSGRPILHFQPHVGSFSGEWFEIIVYDVAANQLLYQHWHNVYGPTSNTDRDSYYFSCMENTGWRADSQTWTFPDLTCFFQLGELNGLEGGKDYQWYIRTYGPGTFSTGGIVGYTRPGGTSDPLNIASFQVRGENPVTGLGVNLQAMSPVVNSLTGTNITNEPRFYWNEAPAATWYEIRVRAPMNPTNPNAEREVFYQQWHQVGTGPNNIRCQNGVCSFTPPGLFFLLNGNYELSVRYWNGGLSTYANTAFSLNAGAPVRVENTDAMIVFNNENLTGTITPVFQWPHAQGNTWYQLRLTGPNFNNLSTFGWFRAFDICHPDPNGVMICTVRPELREMILEAGSFQWALDSWSPSGQAPVTGLQATFNLADQATGVITPVFPVSPLTHTLSGVNTLAFYFNPAPNASWYQIYVGQQNSDGSYAEPVIFDWYYMPSPESYEYPANALNRCGDNDMTFGILDSTRANLCRIVPTTVAENGNSYPTEIWASGAFQWWTQGYGPRGFSTQGVAGTGWVRADFTLDLPKSTGVDQTTIRNQDMISLDGSIVTSVTGVYWERAAVAEWYEVSVFDDSDDELIHVGWTERSAGGCAPQGGSTTCFQDIAATNVFGSPSIYGTYRVRVWTWSRLNAFQPEIEYGMPPEGETQFLSFTIL